MISACLKFFYTGTEVSDKEVFHMLEDLDFTEYIAPALSFYRENARVLPWRESRDPYRIWVSEIMLQQTRVSAVMPYYERFLRELPDIPSLAAADEDHLMKLWEGLGYYSRARNLKKAAGILCSTCDGNMPADYEQILALPGIGPYTAGAIASIAFGLPKAAVDGNVLRILTRVSCDDSNILSESVKKRTARLIESAMTACDADLPGCDCPLDGGSLPGSLNQALMEIGAVICVPNGEPHCGQCPWNSRCGAKAAGEIDRYPYRAPAKSRRREKKTVLLIEDGEKIVITRRPPEGLLAGLYEFVTADGTLQRSDVIEKVRSMDLDPLYVKELPQAKHIFSHVQWDMSGYFVRVADKSLSAAPGDGESAYRIADVGQVQREYPIPSAFRFYAKYVGLRIGPGEEGEPTA